MRNNDDFSAGKAALDKASAAGEEWYERPYRMNVDKSGVYGTPIMLGNQKSGATAAEVESGRSGDEVRIFKGKKNIGALTSKDGTIDQVRVHSDSRRQGVATQMLRLANFARGRTGEAGPLEHSETRTPAGEAWAKSTGDKLPARKASFGIQGTILEDRT